VGEGHVVRARRGVGRALPGLTFAVAGADQSFGVDDRGGQFGELGELLGAGAGAAPAVVGEEQRRGGVRGVVVGQVEPVGAVGAVGGGAVVLPALPGGLRRCGAAAGGGGRPHAGLGRCGAGGEQGGAGGGQGGAGEGDGAGSARCAHGGSFPPFTAG